MKNKEIVLEKRKKKHFYETVRKKEEKSTYHDTWVLRASNNGWKDGTGCIITRKAGLAHTRTIINNESLVGGKKKKEKE